MQVAGDWKGGSEWITVDSNRREHYTVPSNSIQFVSCVLSTFCSIVDDVEVVIIASSSTLLQHINVSSIKIKPQSCDKNKMITK